VAHQLVREDAGDVAQREAVAGVLQHAAVGAAEQVLKVLAAVRAHACDVDVQPRLPAAVAGAAAKLHQQFARVGSAVGLLQAPLQPAGAADVGEVRAHPLEVDAGAGDQMNGRRGLVHGSAKVATAADMSGLRRGAGCLGSEPVRHEPWGRLRR